MGVGPPRIDAVHQCAMFDPDSAVFQALVDAVSSQVVTRLTPVIDTVASNSLHVMYQVRLAMI